MVDRTAVDVSLLWSELQSGELAEGSILVGVRDAGGDVISQVEGVPGPADADWSRIEPGHMTDESVGHTHHHMVWGRGSC